MLSIIAVLGSASSCMWSRLNDTTIPHDEPPTNGNNNDDAAAHNDLELQPLDSNRDHSVTVHQQHPSHHGDDDHNNNVHAINESSISLAAADDDHIRLLPSSGGAIVDMRVVSPATGMSRLRYGIILTTLACMCIIALSLSTLDHSDLIIEQPARNATMSSQSIVPSLHMTSLSSNCSTNCSMLHARCENATCICIDDAWSGPECNQSNGSGTIGWLAFYIVAAIVLLTIIIATVWWSYHRRRCCFGRRSSSGDTDFVSLDKVRATGNNGSNHDTRRVSGRHHRNGSFDSMSSSSSRHHRSNSGNGLTRTKSITPVRSTSNASSSSPRASAAGTRSASRGIAVSSPRSARSTGASAVDTSSSLPSSSHGHGSGENDHNNDPSRHPLNHQNHRYRSTDDDHDEPRETFVYLTPPVPSSLPSSYQSS